MNSISIATYCKYVGAYAWSAWYPHADIRNRSRCNVCRIGGVEEPRVSETEPITNETDSPSRRFSIPNTTPNHRLSASRDRRVRVAVEAGCCS